MPHVTSDKSLNHPFSHPIFTRSVKASGFTRMIHPKKGQGTSLLFLTPLWNLGKVTLLEHPGFPAAEGGQHLLIPKTWVAALNQGTRSQAWPAFSSLRRGGEFCGWRVFSRASCFCIYMGGCHLQGDSSKSQFPRKMFRQRPGTR